MPISEKQVQHLANLARLDLPAAEIADYARQLEAIVGYVEQLSQVDTTGVEPIANVAGLVNVARADEPTPMLPTAKAMGIAPSHSDVAYLVPKVVER
ncbi:MAG: Asp-tRNA(Asn)/Glu-tRNA(Gln) amidotransferase subunit GatC [Planctomycetes bacterium]|nr:Asp-tRNA(Asn)/Glu-tRNA(Gln) amidotransferase subunit GatC [Planctomycetota bacterium]